MWGLSEEPEFDSLFQVEDETLMDLYGTTEPTKEMLLDLQILDQLDRLQGCYAIAYENDKPIEILFTGFSAD